MKKSCSQCLNQQLHVLYINVFWCQSKKIHSQIIAFCKNTHKQKIIYHIWNEIGAEFTSWFMHIVFDIENEFLLILPLLTAWLLLINFCWLEFVLLLWKKNCRDPGVTLWNFENDELVYTEFRMMACFVFLWTVDFKAIWFHDC